MHQLTENLLAGIAITDILDILIVAYIFYKVLGFIRDSRAEQLLKGVLVLLAVAFLSDILQLHVLNFIMKGTLAVGVLALIILFQPELRRALERMGRGSLFKIKVDPLDKEKAKDVVAEFIVAAEEMAADRTGALIVFERDTNLSDIVETGTVIDADVSAQMIENIFYKGSPLHDGAMIVRGTKLYAAGCVLPLTDNMEIPKSLGTRHRAGIGISEKSDCLVLVVSEETGIITLVEDGVIERYLDGKTLEKRLLALYLQDTQSEGSLVKALFKRNGRDD
ncbi:MAG: diadenylate cyclase CdaA [Clostridiales bacterium]|nr:diadenylate cyclase CdaA [Clostridiales bacterium]